MPSVLLSQVKLGDKIVQDVQTPLGGVLFHKGKVITPRELEILQAFMISSVVIEAREGAEDEPAKIMPAEEQKKESKQAASMQTNQTHSMQNEYDQLFKLLKRVHNQFITGESLPILEIRTKLEALLKHIKEYNVLAFLPNIRNEHDYIFHNSVMSAMTSYQLALWNNFAQKDLLPIAMAGLLHDIGNIKVDKNLLYKPTSLTQAEVDEMKQHTVYGYQLLKSVPAINEGVKLAALQHHEKVDGSGYPLGVSGEKIHPYAKIVAIADIFHAMTLTRSYRKPISPYLVLEQIQSESFGKLDPLYVQTFIEKVTQFNIGTVVRLSDDRIGEIVFSDRNQLTRPWVSINKTIVNLTTERHLYIQEIISR
ncbi:HD-GYP domain-containing protein [Paenibacillus abyssi]|uniref:HD family phosphohydrolase n=1 Tax=Paenibacillus abyssi TaxID=1340531 RepID=A0A917LIJ1_9BACL|nr:HD-GYP domain-containing protein [Paenibacillus abyssi]GGG26667.1 HD family phosphohydrolase [Paenibacillus abyssi]